MDGISGLDFDAETFLAVLLLADIFFVSLFGFADILFGAFSLLENFRSRLIGEEEDFLDFLFLLEVEALLMSSSRSLLTSRCILLDLVLTMFELFDVFNLRWAGRLVKMWGNN